MSDFWVDVVYFTYIYFGTLWIKSISDSEGCCDYSEDAERMHSVAFFPLQTS